MRIYGNLRERERDRDRDRQTKVMLNFFLQRQKAHPMTSAIVQNHSVTITTEHSTLSPSSSFGRHYASIHVSHTRYHTYLKYKTGLSKLILKML